MLPDKMIEPGTFARAGDRVRLSIRMPWYRALPLSSVADVVWTIDGAAVPRESLTWTVNGTTYALADLPPRYDEWWYILDSAVLEGDAPSTSSGSGGDAPSTSSASDLQTRPEPVEGQLHDVQVVLTLFIPYITTDFGVLTISETDRKSLVLSEVAS